MYSPISTMLLRRANTAWCQRSLLQHNFFQQCSVQGELVTVTATDYSKQVTPKDRSKQPLEAEQACVYEYG